MVLATVTALAGCGGGGGDSDNEDDVGAGQPSTTVPVATTAAGTTVPGTALTLRITDVRLVNSEESDSGMRVLLPAGVANASVTLTGVPTPNRVISVCQASELDRRQGGASCRTPANGEAATLPVGSEAKGVEIIQIGVSGAGAGGNQTSIDEILIRYTASSREVSVRFPQIAAGESGGRPTLGLKPASSDGAYRAQLGWTVIPVFGGTPSDGQVELVQGTTVANKANGTGADVRLNGNATPAGSDAVLRISNVGSSALVTPKLTVLLP
jgi:hypothetical protein